MPLWAIALHGVRASGGAGPGDDLDGAVQKHEQYLSYLTSDEKAKISEISQNYSDSTLVVLSGQNRPVKTFTFVDCFPISLEPIQFEAKN